MLKTLKYTVCSFIPDLSHPTESYDFGVVIAGEDSAAFIGINLSQYGLRSKNVWTETAFDNTMQVIVNRANEACRKAELKTGFEILDAVVDCGMSSFWYRPIEEKQSSEDVVQAGLEVFASTVGKKLSMDRPQNQKKISDRWCESTPQKFEVMEQRFELAPC